MSAAQEKKEKEMGAAIITHHLYRKPGLDADWSIIRSLTPRIYLGLPKEPRNRRPLWMGNKKPVSRQRPHSAPSLQFSAIQPTVHVPSPGRLLL